MMRTRVFPMLAVAAVCILAWSPWVGGHGAAPAPPPPGAALPSENTPNDETSVEPTVAGPGLPTTAGSPSTAIVAQGDEAVTTAALAGTTTIDQPAITTSATGAAPSTTSVPAAATVVVVTTTTSASPPDASPQPAGSGDSATVTPDQFPDDAGAGGGSGVAVPGAVTPPTVEPSGEDTTEADDYAREQQDQMDREQEARDLAAEASLDTID